MNGRYGGTRVTQVSTGNSLPMCIVSSGSGKAVFIDLVAALFVLVFALKIDDMLPAYMFGGQTMLRESLPLLMIAAASLLALRGLVRLKARSTVEIDGRSVTVSAPPASLAVKQRGSPDDPASQELHVTIHAANAPKAFLFMLAGFGGVLVLMGLSTSSFGAIVAGLLFGGAAYGIWYLQRSNPHQLTVTCSEIRDHDPLVSSRSFVVPFSEIESIKIRDRDTDSARAKKTLKLSGKELLISSDRAEHSAGGGLDDDALDWLRGYLVAAVAKA